MNSTEIKDTALFFGSFNPIHNAHLMIAQQVLDCGLADEVWFVVSPHNPLKDKSIIADVKHRLFMANLAIEGNDRLKVSDIELELPTPSYTINTLTVLNHRFSDRNFSIIMGADNLQNLHKWLDYKKIIETHKLIVYPRTGANINDIKTLMPCNVHLIEANLSHISSTEIRQSINRGDNVSELIPLKVAQYIDSNMLYNQ